MSAKRTVGDRPTSGSSSPPPVCPNCGRVLSAVDLDAQTPPWLCDGCRRGWWHADLDHAGSWRPGTQDFPREALQRGLTVARKHEMATAHEKQAKGVRRGES